MIVAGSITLGSPAVAITAGDVVDKMNPLQQNAFLSGAVAMAQQLYWRAGNSEKGLCAVNWYFRTQGTAREIMGLFENYKGEDAVALLEVLINRHCGK